ncbi:hypothetical protein FLK61_24120 [Paenalkalicoccus suaedae]|uniref:Uncharacterized protein n=1 Tax=Paenalkalicoccus suaedae TaxID=2592382 RepID=A0A859FCC5_9BACI|nr:hypothetical protein [Paenalkalicoccus suaedae]QKS69876.1 hypothetical protein FLK61_24120 [Paenalkalicoccus suaedae]
MTLFYIIILSIPGLIFLGPVGVILGIVGGIFWGSMEAQRKEIKELREKVEAAEK